VELCATGARPFPTGGIARDFDLRLKDKLSRCNSDADGIVRMEENFLEVKIFL